MLQYHFTPEENQEIEGAIRFLVEHILHSSHNKKPVMQHSLQVGFILQECGYEKDVVIAGILHDLIEDTDVTLEDICRKFGTKVASIVGACSFDKAISNHKAQYVDLYRRTVECGKEAVVVKAIDIACNSHYITFVDNKEKQEFLMTKILYFLEVTEKFSQEPAINILVKRVNSIKNNIDKI